MTAFAAVKDTAARRWPKQMLGEPAGHDATTGAFAGGGWRSFFGPATGWHKACGLPWTAFGGIWKRTARTRHA